MSEKSLKIDLFNCTPKHCEGTEIDTVRKGIPTINHTKQLKKAKAVSIYLLDQC